MEATTNGRVTQAMVAVTAAALVVLATTGVVLLVRPFGFTVGRLSEAPEVIVGGLGVSVSVALAGIRRVLAARPAGAMAAGLLAGAAWWPLAVATLLAGRLTAALLGARDDGDLAGSVVVWSTYTLAVGWVVTCPILLPAGLAWAMLARAVARVAHPAPSRRLGMAAVAVLAGTAVVGGAWHALGG